MQDDQNKTNPPAGGPPANLPPPMVGDTTDVPPPPPAGGPPGDPSIPPVIASTNKPKGRFGGRMGKKGKVIATILGLLLLVGSVGIGTVLVQRNQDIREKAGTTTSITDKVTITQNHIDICFGAIGKCEDLQTCGVMVSHFKCDSNNLPSGCQQNGVIKTYAAAAGSTWPFDKGQTCGTQQIDYGCRDKLGTYGSLGFLSYIGPDSCSSPPSCSCTSWQDKACGGDSCTVNKRLQTRDCTPDNCKNESRCVDDIICEPSTPICEVNLRPDTATLNIGSTRLFTADVTNVQNGTVGRVEFTVLSTNPDRLSVDPVRDNSSPYTTTATALNPGTPRIKAEVWMGGEPRCEDISNVTIPRPDEITAQCLEVKVFDTEFNQLDAAGLAALTAGDSVIFTIAGTASEGTFTGARFTINGTTRPVVTEKRPQTEEFMDTYTIPEEITSFSIKGEVRHSTIGWF